MQPGYCNFFFLSRKASNIIFLFLLFSFYITESAILTLLRSAVSFLCPIKNCMLDRILSPLESWFQFSLMHWDQPNICSDLNVFSVKRMQPLLCQQFALVSITMTYVAILLPRAQLFPPATPISQPLRKLSSMLHTI